MTSGRLADPYTGKIIEFRRGKDTSLAVQIDHIIPLGYAYAHGAASWDASTRLAFANDPDNLLAVDGPSNAAKSDSLLATSPSGTGAGFNPAGGHGWDVPNEPYRCTYAAKIDAVAAKYHLDLAEADRHAVDARLAECGTGAAHTQATAAQSTSATDVVVADPPAPLRRHATTGERVIAGLSVVTLAALALLGGGRAWKRH